ncbi:MAG: response regulator [Deltaproteobacteria bacterium]|nr:response regulator [Deltaproteobacteria bacterium]
MRCEYSTSGNIWPVEIDAGQINQVLHNLIINAEQAMPDGGVINMRCENIDVDENSLILKKGRYVKLSVQDNGIGIPEENVNRIFDPYFTTKEHGSGLGLAISYSIIKKHDGLIAVESKLGKGTTFYIYLPASDKKITKSNKLEEKLYTGKEKILVMDDEALIRELLNELLSHIGYAVELAKDGSETIEKYRKAVKSGCPFDAVIMDLTIPGGIGGKEAIKQLLEIDPNTKAIVSSGYSNDPIMAEYKNYGFKGVVAKPYDLKKLSDILHNVIKGKFLSLWLIMPASLFS